MSNVSLVGIDLPGNLPDAWKEITTLRAQLAQVTQERDELLAVRDSLRFAMMLEWRGIEPGCECLSCGGAGVKAYPSTATWHGGFGGQMITSDVCDKCWGSGNRNTAWPSHRVIVEARRDE